MAFHFAGREFVYFGDHEYQSKGEKCAVYSERESFKKPLDGDQKEEKRTDTGSEYDRPVLSDRFLYLVDERIAVFVCLADSESFGKSFALEKRKPGEESVEESSEQTSQPRYVFICFHGHAIIIKRKRYR